MLGKQLVLRLKLTQIHSSLRICLHLPWKAFTKENFIEKLYFLRRVMFEPYPANFFIFNINSSVLIQS